MSSSPSLQDDSGILKRLRTFPSTLETHVLLALVLYGDAATHSSTTHQLPYQLLSHYKHLGGLLQAGFDELSLQEGGGQETTIRLKAALELARRMGEPQGEQRVYLSNPDDAGVLFLRQLRHLDHEQMRVLLLTEGNEIVDNVCLYDGAKTAIATRVAEIFRPALTRNCTRMLLCHLHPEERFPQPSEEDLDLTRVLVEAGDLLDILLLDHIVVGTEGYISLRAALESQVEGAAPARLARRWHRLSRRSDALPRAVRPATK